MLKLFSIYIFLFFAFTHTATATSAPEAPQLNASSWVLLDNRSNTVLAEHNAHLKLPPASLTKMMTAYVVYKALESSDIAMDDMVIVSPKAHHQIGSKMFLGYRERVNVERLIKGINVVSGNDASIALAEYLYDTESNFVVKMNEYASKLGMKNTHFNNATGLPTDNHYSTAYDMALLAQAIITEFPQHYGTYATKEFKHNGVKQFNRNLLLWRDSNVDGVKTGFTKAAGYCLVSSAKKGNTRFISSVFGTESKAARAHESQRLLSYGMLNYESVELYAANTPISETPVIHGQKEFVQFGNSSPVYLVLPKNRAKPNAVFIAKEVIEAPIEEGELLGELHVTINSETLTTIPVYAMNAVKRASFMSRLGKEFKLLFANLF